MDWGLLCAVHSPEQWRWGRKRMYLVLEVEGCHMALDHVVDRAMLLHGKSCCTDRVPLQLSQAFRL